MKANSEPQSDPPPLTIASTLDAMLADLNKLREQQHALKEQLATAQAETVALRDDIRRRDAAEVTEWAPIKVVASLAATPYATVHRWKRDGYVTWRTVNGRVEILLKSVFERIRLLGR